MQVKDTTTTGVGEAVVETEGFDPTETKFPLGGVTVKGDVRVSVFNKLSDDFSAADEMAKVPNAMKAKGLILHFMFHIGFMNSDDDPDAESMFIRSEQHAMKVGSFVRGPYIAFVETCQHSTRRRRHVFRWISWCRARRQAST